MNPSILALLDLQVIDQQRLKLKLAREAKLAKRVTAEKAWQAAEAAAAQAQQEVDRLGSLARQYQVDVERCEKAVSDLRAKQPEAKTNKDYMELINGIEQAKLEKVKREASLRDLAKRADELKVKADEARAKADLAKAAYDATAGESVGAETPSGDEATLQSQYDAKRIDVDPAFLEHYERLVKARHRSPLVRVDPRTRATPLGQIMSHNQLEQIKAGKLVTERGTNAILYLG